MNQAAAPVKKLTAIPPSIWNEWPAADVLNPGDSTKPPPKRERLNVTLRAPKAIEVRPWPTPSWRTSASRLARTASPSRAPSRRARRRQLMAPPSYASSVNRKPVKPSPLPSEGEAQRHDELDRVEVLVL